MFKRRLEKNINYDIHLAVKLIYIHTLKEDQQISSVAFKDIAEER